MYSVGPNKTDDGGNFDYEPPQRHGADVGFRLWDPAHRRRPHAEPAPAGPPGPKDEDPAR